MMPSNEMLFVFGGAWVLLLAGEPLIAILWVLLNAFSFLDTAYKLPALFLIAFAAVVYRRFYSVANKTGGAS
jgi:hypothetical protein